MVWPCEWRYFICWLERVAKKKPGQSSGLSNQYKSKSLFFVYFAQPISDQKLAIEHFKIFYLWRLF